LNPLLLGASEALFQLSYVPKECGRMDLNHHSLRRRGYSPLSSPMLGVRRRGGRPDSNRRRGDHDPEMLPLHHSHHDEDDRIRTGDRSLDRRVLLPLSYVPKRVGRREWLPATGGRVIARTSISGASCCPSALLPARVRAATSSPVGHGGLTKPAAR
jgi:hypothetical protein